MPKTDSIFNSFSIVVGILVLAFMAIIALSPVGKSLDRVYYDALFDIRGALESPDDVVIVGIDEASFAEIDQQWPWPRAMHAHLLGSLFGAGASAVAMDVIFSETSAVEEDKVFSQALNKHTGTFLAMDIEVVDRKTYVQQILVKPANSLKLADEKLGFINVPVQPDSFVRDIELQLGEYKSLSYKAALYKDKTCCKLASSENTMLLNFIGPPGTIKTVSYYQALNPEKYLPEGTFKDKVVFVGFVTSSVADPTKSKVDHFPVPFTHGDVGYMPGVEIHATGTHNLLNDNYLSEISGLGYQLTSVFLALVVTLFSLYVAPVIGLIVVGVLATGILGISGYLFFNELIFLPTTLLLMPMLFGYLVSPSIHLYKSNKEKRFIENAFGSYVSPAIVKELVDNPEMLGLGGKSIVGSVLFLDVAGFTTMSEKFEPAVLIQIMNRCLSSVTEVVMDHDGMIDKFIGDAAMATWGAPVTQDDHALLATKSAVEIQIRMHEVAEAEKQLTGAELSVRVGVNSGEMVAGNVGGHRRFEYTVHGNDVNVASRLEGANKFYGTDIMIGENTAALIGDEFDLRQLDKVRLKGKKDPIQLYEVQGYKGKISEQQVSCNQCYTKGLIKYENSLWQEAIESFSGGLSFVEEDGPCLAMIERCNEFINNPPAEDWGGVYDMTSK